MTLELNQNNPLYPIVRYQADLESQLSAERAKSAQLEASLPSVADAMIADIFAAARFAMQLKIPYKFGAEYENDKAFDCSSLMQSIFRTVNIKLPRTSRDQAKVGTEVPPNSFNRGDLVFFDTNKDGIINHVGFAINSKEMIHTAKPGENVNICNVRDRYGIPVAARRVF